MPDELLTVSVDPASFVRLYGEIDMATAPSVEAALETDRSLRIDLSRVTFLDSSGMSVIARANRRAEQAGHELVVCRPSLMARRAMELGGLAYLLCEPHD
jgi:anti-sigma B factor antagonist